ncbi:bifunctional 3-(3-hydroxy-phenyl)propionate/3-hydroxycinnamic acid hydroxylase [Hirschia baltica]|uniref:Monooxygenase FAD-binding n=1 Tax=Hirschia baltica (strain ATCC 49814 / DSM 5838 / IFAM 1418) TaxID=582402 RepID=C6XP81_HIRBI|nr:bifunctional 3-(3-hydroxy-phenyl)propionate/3-hydroxycinnamic acid hydroxylase [Hirschia baltica]ACT60261.1 monooxygenase FAD-binding [Hirschia baltica ATCC 49814]
MSGCNEYDVIVIGAGPTGMTLALFLAQNGVKTLVLDKEEDVYPLPRAAHIDHEIMRIFQDLGVADVVESTCRSSKTYDFVTGDGRMLMQFDGLDAIGPGGWPVGNMIHQPSIERILRDAASKNSNLDLWTNCEFEAFFENDSGVAVVLKSGEKSVRLSASFLVGADGARSSVRRQAGIEQEDLNFDEPWLVVDAIVHDFDRLPKVNLQICDPERPTSCVLMGSGRHRWEFMLKPDEVPEEMARDSVVAGLLEPWGVEGAVEIERTAVYRFNAKVAKSWRKARVFLAGDAAHLTPPFAGQGMCAGIRDAANLAWKLVQFLKFGASDGLLETYQNERDAHARGYIQLAIAMGQTVCMTDIAKAEARDADMLAARAERRLLAPPPPLHLKAGFLSDSVAAGHYFPQFRLEGSCVVRLDEILGGGARMITRDVVGVIDDTYITIKSILDPALKPFHQLLLGWLDLHEVNAVLIRPDHYVFGTGEPASLVEDWKTRL